MIFFLFNKLKKISIKITQFSSSVFFGYQMFQDFEIEPVNKGLSWMIIQTKSLAAF